jgi:hypothetical protein
MDLGIIAMVLARGFAGILNLAAVTRIYRDKTVESALRFNALLALVGGVVFLFVSGVAVAGVAAHVDPLKLVLILLGVLFIELGIRQPP